MLFCPKLEYACKPPVGDDYVLINLRDGIYVVQHTPQNGALANLKERLGEVLGELP